MLRYYHMFLPTIGTELISMEPTSNPVVIRSFLGRAQTLSRTRMCCAAPRKDRTRPNKDLDIAGTRDDQGALCQDS